MSRISHNPYAAAQGGLAQTERTRSEHVRDDARASHQVALFRGRTMFAHARNVSARLLANKQLAARLRARLAQARRKNVGERVRFAMPRKAIAQPTQQRGSPGATRRGTSSPLSGLHVSRDGRRGGQRGGEQQSSQQDGNQQQQGRQQQQREREPGTRLAPGVYRGAATASPNDTTVPDWLVGALSHEAGGAREQAVADACCDVLLAMRDELAAAPGTPLDARMYRVAREVTLARTRLGPSSATGFDAVRARLVERSRLRSAAKGAGESRPVERTSPAVEPTARIRHFNLLLGLQLLALERPAIVSRSTRADSILASLEAGTSAAGDDATPHPPSRR